MAGEIEPVEAKIPVEIDVVRDPGDDMVPSLLTPLEIGWGDYSSSVGGEPERASECYVVFSRNDILSFLWVTAHWGHKSQTGSWTKDAIHAMVDKERGSSNTLLRPVVARALA